MLWGGAGGDLEVRRAGDGSVRLSGRFPYGETAILSDGGRTGRPRKERFAPGAFSFTVNDAKAPVHLLVGHSFDRPLASRAAGTLTLRDTPTALIFSALVTAAIANTTHGRDALALVDEGLAVGVSPGFRIPPERAVPDAEEVTEEPNDGRPDADGAPQYGALIRTIKAAILAELSIVTRPAYANATVEARNWTPDARADVVARQLETYRHLRQWRL